MARSTFWKNWNANIYSKDKEMLNAIVTSDNTYKPSSKALLAVYRGWMWFYAALIIIVTVLSLSMLGIPDDIMEENRLVFQAIETFAFFILLIDILLRWYTSEVRLKKGNWSYFLFPFTFVGILLIVSLLPSLTVINKDWTFFENLKFVRIFRLILLTNLVPALGIFKKVLQKEKRILYVVFVVVLITIASFALVIYNIEHSKANATITSYWDALYFSTITLTTIGFGDKTPLTDLGKGVTMIMSIIGIAILTIPSGIIAGGFISEVKEATNNKKGIKAIFKKKTPKQELKELSPEAKKELEKEIDLVIKKAPVKKTTIQKEKKQAK